MEITVRLNGPPKAAGFHFQGLDMTQIFKDVLESGIVGTGHDFITGGNRADQQRQRVPGRLFVFSRRGCGSLFVPRPIMLR